ncbi:retrotransposon protein, putative, ty1-copia subclass [Tanacetum coccineum]|uniref:Retrotransposon protein, putative, ty1-copia subclass n=1 Tax=Tanacetum coccineum TaxID=301880 RepID=A0ABQ4Y0Y3_9ASTR
MGGLFVPSQSKVIPFFLRPSPEIFHPLFSSLGSTVIWRVVQVIGKFGSARIHQVPDRYGFYVDVEEYEFGDLDEPLNYKATLLDFEFDKWLEAMNTKMQSIKDNQVWVLVELPPNGQTFRDVKTAFLNGHLSEDIYMVQPEGFMDPKHPNRVCKLQHFIYGWKQASKSWNKRFDVEIKKIGFTQNSNEPCIYHKASGSNVAFLILYVDDILLMRNNVTMLQEVDSWLCSIMYAVRCTRPDVAFAQNLCCFQQNLGEIHWTAVKTILKYLRNTKDMVLVYGAKPKAEMKGPCYAEASFQTNKDDTKSQTGSRVHCAAEVSMEAVWMRKFIDGLRGVMPSNKRPMEMLCDNEPVIEIVDDPEILKGARNFQRKYHYIHEVTQEREIVLKKVHTDDNVDECDVQATNIILHGLPPDVYALVNHKEAAKDIWDKVKLLMKGTELSYQERKCRLYNLFDKFASVQGETLYEYYWRFSELINDMHTIGMTMQQVHVNTKFLNALSPEYSKFVINVKLTKSLYTTNYNQLYAYLSQHERHAQEVRVMRERYLDPLALVANSQTL